MSNFSFFKNNSWKYIPLHSFSLVLNFLFPFSHLSSILLLSQLFIFSVLNPYSFPTILFSPFFFYFLSPSFIPFFFSLSFPSVFSFFTLFHLSLFSSFSFSSFVCFTLSPFLYFFFLFPISLIICHIYLVCNLLHGLRRDCFWDFYAYFFIYAIFFRNKNLLNARERKTTPV